MLLLTTFLCKWPVRQIQEQFINPHDTGSIDDTAQQLEPNIESQERYFLVDSAGNTDIEMMYLIISEDGSYMSFGVTAMGMLVP